MTHNFLKMYEITGNYIGIPETQKVNSKSKLYNIKHAYEKKKFGVLKQKSNCTSIFTVSKFSHCFLILHDKENPQIII